MAEDMAKNAESLDLFRLKSMILAAEAHNFSIVPGTLDKGPCGGCDLVFPKEIAQGQCGGCDVVKPSNVAKGQCGGCDVVKKK